MSDSDERELPEETYKEKTGNDDPSRTSAVNSQYNDNIALVGV